MREAGSRIPRPRTERPSWLRYTAPSKLKVGVSPNTSDPADAVVKSLSKVPNLPSAIDERPTLGRTGRAEERADPNHCRESFDRQCGLTGDDTVGAESNGAEGSPTAVEGARRYRRHLLHERSGCLLDDGRAVCLCRRSGQLEDDEHDHHEDDRDDSEGEKAHRNGV